MKIQFTEQEITLLKYMHRLPYGNPGYYNCYCEISEDRIAKLIADFVKLDIIIEEESLGGNFHKFTDLGEFIFWQLVKNDFSEMTIIDLNLYKGGNK